MFSRRFVILIFLTNLEFSRHIFEKYSNIKFHENLSTGFLADGQTHTVTKPTVAFRTFANTPKNEDFYLDSAGPAGGTSVDRPPSHPPSIALPRVRPPLQPSCKREYW